MLSPYRVLDLADERGLLAGKMLADLGADVIQVEPPDGSTARRVPPFRRDVGAEDGFSLYWAAYAANKRGITCDIRRGEGRELLLRLAATADFLIESSAPGELGSLGLGYDDLARRNPALIYVSITPFGQDGPKAGYADTDLVVWAAGGPLGIAREADRPPVRISVPQSYLHGAADAAGGALIAHFARLRDGRGQHVDVSAQQSAAQATLSLVLAAAVGQTGQPWLANTGGGRWQARDGYVEFSLGMGITGGASTNNFMRWLYQQGGCDAETAARDWRLAAGQIASGELSTGEVERIRGLVAASLARHTRQELLEAALEYRFMLTPVLTTADLARSAHLAARGFFRSAGEDGLPQVRFPAIITTPGGAYTGPSRPAPALGEHNREIYVGDLELSEAEFAWLQEEGLI